MLWLLFAKFIQQLQFYRNWKLCQKIPKIECFSSKKWQKSSAHRFPVGICHEIIWISHSRGQIGPHFPSADHKFANAIRKNEIQHQYYNCAPLIIAIWSRHEENAYFPQLMGKCATQRCCQWQENWPQINFVRAQQILRHGKGARGFCWCAGCFNNGPN